MFEVGGTAYLAREIVEPASGDHPAFLMGVKGEQVKILAIDEDRHYPFTVEGSTNPGKPWRAESNDLMRTKPFAHN